MRVNEPKVPLNPQLGRPAARVSEASVGGLLAGLKCEMGPLDVVREEKVMALRAVIAKGSYRADTQDVARELLRDLLGQLLA